jgi:glycine betaine/proline transport system permease protein
MAIAWLRHGWKISALSGVGLMLIGFLGFWDATMTTLSMIVTAVAFCVIVGVPLGIWSASSDNVENVVRPILDAMQTIHPFVYLVPIVIFFRVGNVPGTLATIIFALPPIVRLTNLGIRNVPSDVVEAGRAFGSSDRQLLFDVQLPLALPTIMAGLNQTLMLALSMVVIVALIGGGGLGEQIFRSVGRVDTGGAVSSGLAVMLLAVVLDRISQVRQRKQTV